MGKITGRKTLGVHENLSYPSPVGGIVGSDVDTRDAYLILV